MFDFFKKKEEPSYDITNLKLTDLDSGFIFDYNLKSWVVKEVYQYDWGNNNFSMEYKIDSGDEISYLSVEDDGDLILSISKTIKIRKIEEDIADYIVKHEKAPREIHFEGERFFLDSDSAGYFRDCTKRTEDWEELVAFEYSNEDESKSISITQWDEETFEAATGFFIEAHEISNILPGA